MVTQVFQIIGDIAPACGEQSIGTGQVSRSVSEMDQITQANAAQTEELAVTAESLSTQADELPRLVQSFKLTARSDGNTYSMTAPQVARGPHTARQQPKSTKAPHKTPAQPATAPVGPGPGGDFEEF